MKPRVAFSMSRLLGFPAGIDLVYALKELMPN
jgi:hypothetical protein